MSSSGPVPSPASSVLSSPTAPCRQWTRPQVARSGKAAFYLEAGLPQWLKEGAAG